MKHYAMKAYRGVEVWTHKAHTTGIVITPYF
jgi:hypothetical protein